jgi:uncharacterized protein YjbI with pentapeptide repeats
MKNIPLGEPGLGPDGAPAKNHDQTPRTRRSFSYQDYAAYALLLKSIDGDPYTELWIEHHDDILAMRIDGRYDLYQVKTRESDEPWMVGDKPILDSIARFCATQANHGDEIAGYYIYSNLRPYVPARATAPERKARSFHTIQHELSLKNPEELLKEYADTFHIIKKATGADEDILISVLSKLHFIVGPSLDSFRADWPAALCVTRPKLKHWPIMEVLNLQNELLRRITAASSAEVPPLLLHTSPISAGGLPSIEISWRRISTLAIKRKVSRRMIQRKVFRSIFTIGKIAVCMVAGGILFRPLLQISPLQHALNVIQRSGNGVLPAEFDESVAIIRAAHKPLQHLDLDGANIECRDLSGLSMLRASGQSMHATGTTFDNSILAGAILNQSELNGAKFRYARMDNALLQKSNMLAANLFAAEARNANFSEATLNGANLSHGVFTGTNFNGANLESAEMRNADLSKTELNGVVLKDADVSGVNFTGARHLTQTMLASACVSDAKRPTVDKPLQPTTRPCYTTPQEQEERQVKRFAILAVGQMAVSQGYCKEFQHKFRPSDSTLHPQDNEKIWLGEDELGQESQRRVFDQH